jgi:hypothetical protein
MGRQRPPFAAVFCRSWSIALRQRSPKAAVIEALQPAPEHSGQPLAMNLATAQHGLSRDFRTAAEPDRQALVARELVKRGYLRRLLCDFRIARAGRPAAALAVVLQVTYVWTSVVEAVRKAGYLTYARLCPTCVRWQQPRFRRPSRTACRGDRPGGSGGMGRDRPAGRADSHARGGRCSCHHGRQVKPLTFRHRVSWSPARRPR